MLDICVVAHVTRDVNTTPAGVKELTGGAAYYLGMALQHLKANFQLVTKLAPEDSKLLSELDASLMKTCPSAHTHFFENIYHDLSDNRLQKVHNLATPFDHTDIEKLEAKVFHLGPLSSQDMPIEVMAALKKRGKVSLDAQGFLRTVINEEVHPVPWPEMDEGLEQVDILKVNDFEAELLTGEKDMRVAAKKLAQYGIEEVVITMGGRNSVVLFEGAFFEIPAYPPQQIIDATGCGDTYMAGYLFQRTQGVGVPRAAKFGAAVATLKMENFGPFRGNALDVQQLLEASQ